MLLIIQNCLMAFLFLKKIVKLDFNLYAVMNGKILGKYFRILIQDDNANE